MADNNKVSAKMIGIICVTLGILNVLFSIAVGFYSRNMAIGIGCGGTGLFCLGIGLYLLNMARKNS